jgi:hypothetical protein
MADDPAVTELEALAAIAAENGAVLAFRAGEEATELEPVFVHVMSANHGDDNEVALIAIDDRNGLNLGRYVISRGQLDGALAAADDVDETDAEPTVVPADWSNA